ncbi:MAG: NAD-dependent epimerase/dehydratase family protein [Chloroflexi bacterium]|nr:NAD-dependent epimerase/dehydratase family protein [Chloroflexota bacterium]
MFFGREDVFEFIQQTLIGRHQNNIIVLYGQRRTGKTSVLYQMRRHLGPDYLHVLIDLQAFSLDGIATFLWEIAGVTCRTLRREYDIRVEQPQRREFATDPRCEPDIVIFVGGRSSAPHFASLADVMDEIETWKATLEWCVRDNIRLIFASTSSLSKIRPSVESQRVWPGSYYELTKLMMEEMSIQQALVDGLTVQICRFFAVYGVTERHKGAFGNLYTQILWHAREDVPFEVWGQEGVFKPGEQTRDTIFATEVARAILYLLTLPEPEPTLQDISSLMYNVGQGKPLSVAEMVKQVSEVLQKEPEIVETEVPAEVKNYVDHTWGDPTKLLDAGFVPIFTDNVTNLRFINRALTDLDWYWSSVETIRNSVVAEFQ